MSFNSNTMANEASSERVKLSDPYMEMRETVLTVEVEGTKLRFNHVQFDQE